MVDMQKKNFKESESEMFDLGELDDSALQDLEKLEEELNYSERNLSSEKKMNLDSVPRAAASAGAKRILTVIDDEETPSVIPSDIPVTPKKLKAEDLLGSSPLKDSSKFKCNRLILATAPIWKKNRLCPRILGQGKFLTLLKIRCLG
jgi:hypothetical protein